MAKVYIIESERGWGQRIDETKEFASMAEARRYAASYNAKHNPPLKAGESVPEWYMYAKVEGDDGYGLLRG